jgi:hypothetical protein
VKNSIKVLLISAVMGIHSISLKAQDEPGKTGVYLTEKNYKSHKLSYALGSGDKLQLNEFLGGQNIDLFYQGKKIKLAKETIFGYRDNGKDFRLYHNDAYRIIDTAGFLLYSREKLAQQGKGYIHAEQYFYSLGTAKPLVQLTIRNLCNSFADKPGFRYSIESSFKKDADLANYDRLSKQYKIKYFYFQHPKVLAAHTETSTN